VCVCVCVSGSKYCM
jgi:hypothetical protein